MWLYHLITMVAVFALIPASAATLNETKTRGKGLQRLILKSFDSPPEWMTTAEIRKYLAESREMNVMDITPFLKHSKDERKPTGRFISEGKYDSPFNIGFHGLDQPFKEIPQIPEALSFQGTVPALLGKVDKSRIQNFMEDIAGSFPHRYSVMGQDSAEYVFHHVLRNIMKPYKGIYYMRKFEISRDRKVHFRNATVKISSLQPNLVVRLEGSNDARNEIVILGAHLDSIPGVMLLHRAGGIISMKFDVKFDKSLTFQNNSCAKTWRCLVDK